MTHSPMTLFECIGDVLAWRVIIASSLVVVAYWYIGVRRLMPAALAARTSKSRMVWWSLAFIFPFCAIGGYASTAMAGWFPAEAYRLREIMCYCDVFACILFVWATTHKKLQAIDEQEYDCEVADLLQRHSPHEVLSKVKERL